MTWTIIDVRGSHGDILAKTIQLSGYSARYYSTPAKEFTDNVIFVTYGLEGFPRVMTVRFIDTVLEPYKQGNKESFESWKKHYLGNVNISSPLDITKKDWAHHIAKSLKHVGKYYPYNGLLETLLTENKIKGKYLEINLNDIVNHRALDILINSGLVLSQESQSYFTDAISQQNAVLQSWLEEYSKVEKLVENGLYSEIIHNVSY
jgi:hypothetical protein